MNEVIKTKDDYPIVLGVQHVQEIMDCSESSARNYIRVANKQLQKEGVMTDVIRLARIPRNQFFKIYGITG